MKNILFISFFVVSANLLFAQQRPHYSQYILNSYIINPAFTGIENYVDVKTSIRNQWVGINGTPKTIYLTAHTPINKNDYRETATSFHMKNSNPRGEDFTDTYNPAEPHHGVGISAFNYSAGLINRTNIMATYAYHMGLSEKWSLGAGFGAGFSNNSLLIRNTDYVDQGDPLIGQFTGEKATLKKIKPDLSAGILLYSQRFYIGISGQQLIPVKLDFKGPDAGYEKALVPHLFSTIGYKIPVNEYVSFTPSAMVRYIENSPLTVDLNFKIQYIDLLWLGANVRRGDGTSAILGINFNRTVNFSYAYDMSAKKTVLGPLNRGTHEIVIGFTLKNNYGDMSPKNVW